MCGMSPPWSWLCASLSRKQAALTLPQTTTVAPLVGLAEAITAGELEQECIAPFSSSANEEIRDDHASRNDEVVTG